MKQKCSLKNASCLTKQNNCTEAQRATHTIKDQSDWTLAPSDSHLPSKTSDKLITLQTHMFYRKDNWLFQEFTSFTNADKLLPRPHLLSPKTIRWLTAASEWPSLTPPFRDAPRVVLCLPQYIHTQLWTINRFPWQSLIREFNNSAWLSAHYLLCV